VNKNTNNEQNQWRKNNKTNITK